MLSQTRLKELLSYDAETGFFTRLVRTSNCVRIGQMIGVAPTKGSQGYVMIRVDAKKHKAHRLAWLYMTGRFPEHDIDHIDGDRRNNAWANLRDVTRSVNVQNLKGARVDNASGYLGVNRHGRRWQARIGVLPGKNKHLGTFDSAEEAHAAYLAAKRALHAGCTI